MLELGKKNNLKQFLLLCLQVKECLHTINEKIENSTDKEETNGSYRIKNKYNMIYLRSISK